MMRVVKLAYALAATLVVAFAPASATAQTLAGEWRGSVTCNGLYNEASPSSLKITLSPTGGSSYALTASFQNTTAAGTVDGSQVSWSGGSFFNALTATGNVNKDRMSGEYSQSMGPTCIWQASKVSENEFTATSAERPTDGMGVDCGVRKEMLATELKKATDKMAELDRLPANCELNRTNLARTVNGYGESIVTMSRYLSKCNMVEAAEFTKRGEWFYTAGSELITSCTQ
jgi:hypothetical protein